MKNLLLVTVLVTSQLAAAVPPIDGHAAAATAPDDNESPLADAGQDQTVSFGRTVELDARGSRDPDGTIQSYRWSIRSPGGVVFAPDCNHCASTAFRVNETGEFAVTLAVTDDDGATSRDTLFVSVSGGQGPSLSLSGPSSAHRGQTTTFTATPTAGAASLDRVAWSVDGSLVATRSIDSPGANRISPAFPTNGRHTVRAVVYDDLGRSATDSIQLRVTVPAVPSGNNSTTPPSNGGGNGSGSGGGGGAVGPPLSSQHDPTVDGPRVVTGIVPLIGNYRLSNAPPMTVVENVTWHTATGPHGDGDQTRLDWAPGDHQLFAVVTYTDGSTDIATFDGGRTTVVADPAPKIGLLNIRNQNDVSGDIVASDAYGNLMEVTVTVGNRTVFHEEGTRRGKQPGLGERRVSSFTFEQIEPNRTYTVELTAVDGRGQRKTTTREVTPVGAVEIVRAGFVNGPVDSHHRRLDPSRYTAHHIVEVDLNGNDPEDVSAAYFAPSKMVKKLSSTTEIRNVGKSNRMTFHSYWSGWIPSEYDMYYRIVGDVPGGQPTDYLSTFEVQPSDPELVITTEDHGTNQISRRWAYTIDATRSFDPDHTELDFEWPGGADALDENPAIGRLRAREDATLVVSDQNGGVSTRGWDFLQFFVPDIEAVNQINEGPFNATDTVHFRVRSEPFAFTKTREDYRVDLLYQSSSEYVEIVSQGRINSSQVEDPHDATSDRLQQQIAEIRVPAAALANGRVSPEVVLVNERNPGRIRSSVTLPSMDIELMVRNSTVYENISVESMAYRVRRDNVTLNETVDDRAELRQYLSNGYNIEDVREVATGIQLERLEEVRGSKTERKTFQSESDRRDFLRLFPEWVAAGQESNTRHETVTRHEWRSSRMGDGRYTGETKQKTVPAQERTLKQFQYQTRKTKTVEKEIEKTVEVTKTHEKEVEVERCNPRVGCYIDTVIKEVTETVTEARTVVVEREEPYWETRSYWSRFAQSSRHRFTGETKQVVVRPSYEQTLYQYEISEDVTVQDSTYFATRSFVVSQQEWKQYRTVEDRRRAQKAAGRKDIRINGTVYEPRWTVSKPGTAVLTVAAFEDEENVVETIAIVSGSEKKKEFIPSLGEVKFHESREFREEIRRDGVISMEEMMEILENVSKDCIQARGCNI
ncbi:PKD domain-containing protein [Haloarchaeobius sp. DT45]|uniref:PKD domain-containing protein n=1 Tax=Haloarchaeobius sp. DT45 TaxID=3446116 RepID=UPI003F6BB696